MDLSIYTDMPLTVEAMSPKWAMNGVGLMISFTVGALERVRARFTSLSFESRWVSFIIRFAAPTELSVVFQLVGAVTLDTPSTLDPTRHGGVIPLPTIFAEGDIWVHIRTSDGGNKVSYIEAPVNKHFRVLTALDIPDVDPYKCHVQFWGDFDYSWF